MPRTVLAAGYVPLDIVVFGKRVWRAAGGTAGNVAAILSFLGWRSGVIADLGDDAAGREVVRDLRKANVNTGRIRLCPDRRSPRVVHEIKAESHRFVFRCPACGSRFPHSRPLPLERADAVAGAEDPPDVFFFDRLNAGTIRLAERFAGAGSMVVFEPARVGQPRLLQRAIAVADVVKYSDERIEHLEPYCSPKRRQVRVMTRGAAGARYRVGNARWLDSPAYPYPVVDAGGAGDWTTAGLIHALGSRPTSARAVGDALRWAQALAAVSCGAPGARGLARQQTAEAVLRAAHFLENHQAGDPPLMRVVGRRSTKAAEGRCDWCLLPTASRAVASDAL